MMQLSSSQHTVRGTHALKCSHTANMFAAFIKYLRKTRPNIFRHHRVVPFTQFPGQVPALSNLSSYVLWIAAMSAPFERTVSLVVKAWRREMN